MQKYFITPPNLFGVVEALEYAKKYHNITKACFRDPVNEQTLAFVEFCKKNSIQSFLNTPTNSIEEALEYGFDGIHLKEKNSLPQNIKNAKKQNLKIFCSTHSIDMALSCVDCDFVTLSPIFLTPNKQAPLGVEYFEKIPNELKGKVFALGGICDKNIHLIQNLGIAGFGAIRYFLPK